MTGTGWYNIPTLGTRDGAFDMNFTDAQADNRPAIRTAAWRTSRWWCRTDQQRKFAADGAGAGAGAAGASIRIGRDATCRISSQSNPAWILLDILAAQRMGQSRKSISPASRPRRPIATKQIGSTDLNGNAIIDSAISVQPGATEPAQRRRCGPRRPQCGAPVSDLWPGRSAAISRWRTRWRCSSPRKVDGCNSTEALNGGWPSYEFGDGSNGFSGILRLEQGNASVTVPSRASRTRPIA